MRKTKKSVMSILALALVLTAAVGTMAYFSDRVTTNASMTTIDNGVEVTPDTDNPEDPDPSVPVYPDPTPEDQVDPTNPDPIGPSDPDYLAAKWAAVNATALANYNPGDKIDLSYTLYNTGNLAVDVRETFVVTSDVAMDAETPQFRLFTAATQDAAGAWIGTDVVTNQKKLDDDGKKFEYTVAPYVLNSTEETVDGAVGTSVAKNYMLVFDKMSLNAFQNAGVTIEYIVEVKQHTEGGEDDWKIARTGTVDLGGYEYSAVPTAID